MSKPASKSMLTTRQFIDMKPADVLERKEQVGDVATLSGIKSKYEYITMPDGSVKWRRLPCCCTACLELRWEQCLMAHLVGELETVVEPGASLYKAKK